MDLSDKHTNTTLHFNHNIFPTFTMGLLVARQQNVICMHTWILMHLFFAGLTSNVTTISVTPFPRYGNVLGGTLIQVFGPCFDALINSSITCHFDAIETRGFLFADENYVVCISPSLKVIGRVSFRITVPDLFIESEESTFYSCELKCKCGQYIDADA